MNAWQRLIAILKIVTENIRVLHRNLEGGEWFPVHEKLGEYYATIDDIADDLIEIGLGQGIPETTIQEAIKIYKPITADPRNAKTSLTLVKGYFTDIVALMMEIADDIEEEYIADKLRTYVEQLIKEAEYKMARAIK